ncbi:hypothetical protein NDU88_000428, partial [Pleurodeles waltl]
GSLGGSDELVVSADGVFEGCEVVQCLILAPLLFESLACLLRFLDISGEPEALSVSCLLEGFLVGARVLAQSSIHCLRLQAALSVLVV